MNRWSEQDLNALKAVRTKLKSVLSSRPQYPDVVGDRKLLRFIRGHNYNIEKACEMISKFLNWRDENKIDDIRNNIINGPNSHPSKFPKADIISGLIKQVTITPFNFDRMGCPVCVDQYDFSPSEVLKIITIQDYILYIMYTLEYRSLILEQLSDEREKSIIQSQKQAIESGTSPSQLEPYGQIAQITVIRDLKGITLSHIGSQGQEIVRAVIGKFTFSFFVILLSKC